MIKIGYQGITNSNSEEAAKNFVKKMGFKEYLLLPLVSSFNVLDNVANGKIEYGVVAYENNTGGKVIETVQTLKFLDITLVDTITIPINHYLFVKDKSIKIKDIEAIASHPQAFTQCSHNLDKFFFDVPLIKDEDTATAARKLNLNLFNKNTAVLCRLNAGKDNNLHLLKSNLEDKDDNTTTFKVFTK